MEDFEGLVLSKKKTVGDYLMISQKRMKAIVALGHCTPEIY